MIKCKICNSINCDNILNVREMMFGTRKFYGYCRCGDCGCLQIINGDVSIEDMYPASYYSFRTGASLSFLTLIKKFIYKSTVKYELEGNSLLGYICSKKRPAPEARSLQGIINKNDKILDIGCGSGSLLEALSKLDYKHLTGIEPYIHIDIIGKGFSVYKKELSDLDTNQKFDIIMMHHSFEHMNNPSQVLKEIKDLLSERGICIIRIPVADSFAFDHYKENWVQLDAPRHIFLHTNKSIEILSSNAGMKVSEIKNDSGPFQFYWQ